MKTLILPRPIVCAYSDIASPDKNRATLSHDKACPKPAPGRNLVLLALIIALGLASASPAGAQLTFQRLKSFGIPGQAAANPGANLIRGSDGALYGTTILGGAYSGGTVFKMNTNGTGFTVIHNFGMNNDGYQPQAALVQGMDGALYGTTYYGGTNSAGTVFKLNPDGSGYEDLYSFGLGGNTMNPVGALVQGSDGTLYGTTSGGPSYHGTVFKVSTNGSGFLVLHTFTGTSGDGSNPSAALMLGSDGMLYGTTEHGGSSGGGTVFKLQTSGSGYMVIHPFTGTGGDGENPAAALIQGSDGALYGTTKAGGSDTVGAVFKLNTDGSDYTSLYSFTFVGGMYPYGLSPEAALVQGSDGELYGTTAGNNGNVANGEGTVFKLNTNGAAFTTLYSFAATSTPQATNVDGAVPVASLIQLADGAFYGTASQGGNAVGTVFKLNGDGSNFTVLQSFSDTGGDGIEPTSALVQGNNGTLYGSTSVGGTAGGEVGAGTVFKLNPDGSGYTILINLGGLNNGSTPANAVNVILGRDGVLYGTEEFNGSNNLGEVFKANTNGTAFTVLHTFTGALTDGAEPDAALVQGSDGAFYGTTMIGGSSSIFSSGYGTVFKLNTNGGGYQVLYAFSPATDGGYPTAALVQGSDGMLYGTTTQNGINGLGTAFKLATNGSGFTVIHSFGLDNDGQQPQAALVQGKDGFLYGTTFYGGTNQDGMIFKVSTDGSVYADIFDFSSYAPDTSGSSPNAPLVQGSDGALYGTTLGGGGDGYGDGTVFKLNTNGSGFTVLYTFLTTAPTNGDEPYAALLQGKDGSFYGTTFAGGDMGFGTIFALVASQFPTLYISQSGPTVRVFWQDVSGWTLQQNNNLALSADWSASSGVTTSNGTNYLNITTPTGDLFFRLTHP